MTQFELVDDYGQVTRFDGELLVQETSDTEDERKPQYTDIDVWRTSRGNFVVLRQVHYRYRHASRGCERLDGNITLREPRPTDTYSCPKCNPLRVLEPGMGYGMASRKDVDIYPTAGHLIKSMEQPNGSYSGLSKSILSELSTKDDDIKNTWSVREA